jgi:CheY-like chemotaxis protein
MRILVVDDDESIRILVERILRRERHAVDSARDGFEAIQKLSTGEFEVVLLDLMMPRIDGLGVLEYLEDALDGPLPAVIVMTANVPNAYEVQRKHSVRTVLAKPFDIVELIRQVHESGRVSDTRIAPEHDPRP